MDKHSLKYNEILVLKIFFFENLVVILLVSILRSNRASRISQEDLEPIGLNNGVH